LVEGRLQVHLIEASAEDAENAARVVCTYLQEADIEAAQEEDIGSSLILRGCLPFTVYEATERKFRRRRRLLSRDFADMHPAGRCWKGIPPSANPCRLGSAPIVMYSNPVGETLFLDPSKAERNPHALVVGQSGSGKSFFVHDYILHLWRMPNVRLFLISIKPDYRKLALLLGRYIELTLDSAESLNPFSGAPTLDNQARWVAALSLMITEGRSAQHLCREKEIALQEASLAAATRNWDSGLSRPIRETVLEDICLELERRSGPLGRELAFQLLPYRRGPFRRLFNGQRSLSIEDRFVFFNLSGILQQPCSAAASFCIFSLIDQVMHEPSLRAVPKGLIADEVWALVQDPFAAAILERSLKAYRSLGGFAVPIVQDPRDLDTPAGRVILVNTATKVILPMDRTGQDEISRFVRLNERELELVRNLRLLKRRYSEFFFSVEGIRSAKGLVIPDPLRYAISTTDPADEAELDRLFQSTGDMLRAVQQFAQDMPYGIRAEGRTFSHSSQGRSRWALLLTIPVFAMVLTLVVIRPRFASRGRTTQPAAAPEAPSADRQTVAEEVARLLTMSSALRESNPAPHSILQERRPDSRSKGATPDGLGGPMHSAGEGSSVPSPVSVATNSARQPRTARKLSPFAVRSSPSSSSGKSSASLPQIPEQIEDTSMTPGSDPLQQMSLRVDLQTVAPSLFPGALFEIRGIQEQPQARFSRGPGLDASNTSWFEAGDTVVSGWMLVRIESNSATVMSSQGDFVRLLVSSSLTNASALDTPAR